MSAWHVAQVNVARLRAPIDAPETAEFVALLDPVNAFADAAPGFVWRMQDEGGNATSVRIDDDPMMIVNMSVWETIDALAEFVLHSAHSEVMRRRREWFERMNDAYVALWWIRAGTIPTVDDAAKRIDHIRTHGPTEFAFTLRQRFDSPAS